MNNTKLIPGKLYKLEGSLTGFIQHGVFIRQGSRNDWSGIINYLIFLVGKRFITINKEYVFITLINIEQDE